MALTTKYNIQQDDELMNKILASASSRWRTRGYQFEAAEGSFDLLVKKCAGVVPPVVRAAQFPRQRRGRPGRLRDHRSHGQALHRRRGQKTVVRHEVAEGDGPVNALDAALRKALSASYPNLADMQLVDYKVRVINSEAATAAGVLRADRKPRPRPRPGAPSA